MQRLSDRAQLLVPSITTLTANHLETTQSPVLATLASPSYPRLRYAGATIEELVTLCNLLWSVIDSLVNTFLGRIDHLSCWKSQLYANLSPPHLSFIESPYTTTPYPRTFHRTQIVIRSLLSCANRHTTQESK